jgi:hypothetical protein
MMGVSRRQGRPDTRARVEKAEGRNGEDCERPWSLQEKATTETIGGVRGFLFSLMGNDD